MLLTALKAEIDADVAAHAEERDDQGHALVVRNGVARSHKLTTAAGELEIEAPSSTWVTRQFRQRDRRGRSRTVRPWSRSVRQRGWPHGRSSPPHPGHAIWPAINRDSTDSASASTICIPVHLAST